MLKRLLILSIMAALLAGCGRDNEVNENPVYYSQVISYYSALYIAEEYIADEIEEEISIEEYVEVRQPMVALSFDDGPSRYTLRILDILERYGGRATFFVLGYRVAGHRNTIMRAFEMGNEIANHTWSHARLTLLTDEEVAREILDTSAAIAAVLGESPPMFRPPFGATDERIWELSYELGYSVVKWTLDPFDWRDRDADMIYDSIMGRVQDGSVIVLHDIHPTTAQAMERVIPGLIEEGFKLVTVSELLGYFYGGLEPGVVYGWYTEL